MSRTTPTISNSPDFSNEWPMRRPRASPSAKSLRAAASLRIATLGAVVPSWSVNARPRCTGIPSVAKNAGETSIMYMFSSAAVCDVWPCVHVELVLVLPESSVVRVSAVAVTPGRDDIRSSTWRKTCAERAGS